MSEEVVNLEEEVMKLRDRFDAMKIEPAMSFDREAEWALQMIYKPTDSEGRMATRDCALDNVQAMREAILNIAAIGVTLNPASKLAYILVRDRKVVYDLSYLGLVELAVNLGVIRWAQADLVYERDKFRRLGIDKAPVHDYDPFEEDRGALRGCYVVAKLHDGDFLTTTMSKREIDEIAVQSRGYSSKYSPWKRHYGEMAKKTVIKRASKLWKTSNGNTERLDRAIHFLNTENDEGIDFRHTTAAPPAPSARHEHAAYPQESFDKNLAAWRKRIESGKNTADEIIAKVESKATLTEQQKQLIRGEITDAPAADEPQGQGEEAFQ